MVGRTREFERRGTMNEVYLSKQTVKVLKDLLKKENNEFGGKDIPENEYENIEEEIKELKDVSFVKITWLPQINEVEDRIYRIQITQDGKSYFKKQRENKFRFWFPTIISIGAFIMSIFSFICA
jgi:hypothetical protein